jgi:uncharacterized protein (DUF2267 family)
MTTGLAVFDTSVQDTNRWLKTLQEELGDCERQEAYVALRAVLHALRDRLQAHAAVKLAAQLPMLVRGLFYEGWTLPEGPTRSRTPKEFADAVREGFGPHFRFDPMTVTRAVFGVLASFVSPGEAIKLKAQLSEGLRALWPAGEMV